MEPEGSVPCSQEPATGPYLESDESTPRPHKLFFRVHFKIIPPPMYAYLVISSLQDFLLKFCTHLSYIACVLYVPPIFSSVPFMEPEGSLPCAQEPATGPYPESDESTPHPHKLFF
jgi:hypothetical protein